MFIGAAPSRVFSRGRRTAEEYTDIGRRFYQTTRGRPTGEASVLTKPMNLLCDNFGVARKFLNIVSEKYLLYCRIQVFDVGMS